MSDVLKNYLSFIPKTSLPIAKQDNDYIFIYKDNQILIIKDKNTIRLTTRKDLKNYIDNFKDCLYLGDLDGIHCYTLEIQNFLNISNFDGKPDVVTCSDFIWPSGTCVGRICFLSDWRISDYKKLDV